MTAYVGLNSGQWFGDVIERDNIVIGAVVRSTVSGYFQGQIDDVRIYSYALTAEQVLNAMNSGAAVRF